MEIPLGFPEEKGRGSYFMGPSSRLPCTKFQLGQFDFSLIFILFFLSVGTNVLRAEFMILILQWYIFIMVSLLMFSYLAFPLSSQSPLLFLTVMLAISHIFKSSLFALFTLRIHVRFTFENNNNNKGLTQFCIEQFKNHNVHCSTVYNSQDMEAT